MPVGGMPKAVGIIEDRDPELLSINDTVIIDPIGALSPDLRLAFTAFGVHHVPRRSSQLWRHSDCKCAFFGVANLQRAVVGSNHELAIDDSGVRVTTERKLLRLFCKRFLIAH